MVQLANSTRETPMNFTGDELLVYGAAFFDCEGSISMKKRETHPALVVTIYQNDRRPLDLLRERFGGYIHEGFAGCHSLTFSHQKAAAFLQAVRPWLIVKARRADLGIELAATYVGFRGLRTVPDNVLRKRKELMQAIYDLNGKGTKVHERKPGEFLYD